MSIWQLAYVVIGVHVSFVLKKSASPARFPSFVSANGGTHESEGHRAGVDAGGVA